MQLHLLLERKKEKKKVPLKISLKTTGVF